MKAKGYSSILLPEIKKKKQKQKTGGNHHTILFWS